MRIFYIFLLLGLSLSAQELRLQKGIVIDSIAVNDTINQTFSIYLPTSYEPGKAMPVLFIFDSQGRGKVAAQLYKPAAEEQGYLLISSNNIDQDKTLQENVQTAAVLIRGVSTMIPVDISSTSVAGIGAGAQVATSIPFLYRNVHGVMAVGDLHFNLDFVDEVERFVFVGVVGAQQMAIHAMNLASRELGRRGFPGAIYTFDGGRQWPGPDIISSALGSLTLEAMKKELRPQDLVLVEDLYQDDLGRVDKLISTGQPVLADELMDIMQSKYEGVRDVLQVRDKRDQLQQSQNYKDQQKDFRRIQEKEDELSADYQYYLNEDIPTANFENLGWWNYQVLQLDEYIKGDNPAEAAMGHRVKDLLRKLVDSHITELNLNEAGLDYRLFAYMLKTVFDQTDYNAYLNVISLSARDGDFSSALFYLEELLKNGYSNMEALYEIDGTLGLRITRDFNWLIDKYLGSSKFFQQTN